MRELASKIETASLSLPEEVEGEVVLDIDASLPDCHGSPGDYDNAALIGDLRVE